MKPRMLVAVILASLCACGPKNLDARMAHGERRANEADDHLRAAEEHMTALEPDKAQDALSEAREALSDPDVEYYPDRGLVRERLDRLTSQLPQVRAERTQRDLAERVQKQRARLDGARRAFEAALEVLAKKKDLEEDDADKAEDLLEDLEEALGDGAAIEREDKGYAKEAKDARALVARGAPRVKVAFAVAAFREGPSRKSVAGKEQLARGAAKDDQIDHWHDARDAFADCASDGEKLIEGTPSLASAVIQVGTKAATAKSVVAACVAEVKSLDKRIKAEHARRERAEARAKKPIRKKK